MLTTSTLWDMLAAAFEQPKDQIGAYLTHLAAAGLLPADQDAALGTLNLAAVLLAFLSGARPEDAVAEVLRMSGFPALGVSTQQWAHSRTSGSWVALPEPGESAIAFLAAAIERARIGGEVPGATAFQIRRIRSSDCDVILFETRRSDGDAVAMVGLCYGAPVSKTSSALIYGVELTLPWLLVSSLAEALGPLPQSEADELGASLPETEGASCALVH